MLIIVLDKKFYYFCKKFIKYIVMAKKTEKAINPDSSAKKVKSTVSKKVKEADVVPVEKTKYSDEELLEFKELILAKLEEAKVNLKMLKEAFANDSGSDINDTSPTFKIIEDGSEVMSKEENAKLASRQNKFIESLELALIRIQNKSYGVCRETGKLIPKQRLMSVPHATLSIEAKQGKK